MLPTRLAQLVRLEVHLVTEGVSTTHMGKASTNSAKVSKSGLDLFFNENRRALFVFKTLDESVRLETLNEGARNLVDALGIDRVFIRGSDRGMAFSLGSRILPHDHCHQ